MPNKRRNIENHKVRLSTIVERLPLYRFLDHSHATVLKLQPAWQAWLNSQRPDLDQSAAHISAFDGKTLTISVNNASTAALIKHQQSSLLSTLNGTESTLIAAINVRIDLATTLASAEHKKKLSNQSVSSQTFSPPDQTSINSIKHLQATIKNPELANAIGQLAETLKKLSQTSD